MQIGILLLTPPTSTNFSLPLIQSMERRFFDARIAAELQSRERPGFIDVKELELHDDLP